MKNALQVNFINSSNHFFLNTSKSSQSFDAKCFSTHKWIIECFCLKTLIFRTFRSKLKSHLVIVSINLIYIWMKQFEKLFNNEKTLLHMILKILWYEISTSLYRKYSFDVEKHARLLIDKKIWRSKFEQKKIIVLIKTHNKINEKVFEKSFTMKKYFQKKIKQKNDSNKLEWYYNDLSTICWESVIINEYHLCKSVTNSLMIRLNQLIKYFINQINCSIDKKMLDNSNFVLYIWELNDTSWKRFFDNLLALFIALYQFS